MDKLRLQLMGPPCTKWSCAQTKDRETVPSGIGWELFLNLTRAADIAQLWIDYIDAAAILGYDLTNPLMQMPKDIKKKHDAATKAAAPVIAARRMERNDEQSKARYEQVSERYEFAMGDYIIRAPINADEIVEEGKRLKHCVGGYADRHIKGKLAILFLRAAKDPHTPLVTIEMQRDNLRQIQGYKNNAGARIPPREKYAEILEPWLAWVKAGSKRDKDGNPKIPKKKKEAHAA